MTLSPIVRAAAAALLFAAGAASATTAVFNDFSSVTGLTLNGNAAVTNNVLRLVPAEETQAGSAFLTEALDLTASTGFQTHFGFRVTTESSFPTDGFAFLLQGIGKNALGEAGEGLGYVGLTPSVAVVFRGRNPNLIGVIADGTNPNQLPDPFKPPGYYSGGEDREGEFYNKDMNAWIDYDASSTILQVYLSTTQTRPTTALMTATVDLYDKLGQQPVYVGFSAGNGLAFGDQDILNWQFVTTPVPEAGSAAMLALGLLSLALLRRGARR